MEQPKAPSDGQFVQTKTWAYAYEEHHTFETPTTTTVTQETTINVDGGSSNETTTTPRTETANSFLGGCDVDTRYVRSIEGILKVVSLVSSYARLYFEFEANHFLTV